MKDAELRTKHEIQLTMREPDLTFAHKSLSGKTTNLKTDGEPKPFMWTKSAEDILTREQRVLDLYNRRRPHPALDGRTPDNAYFGHESMPPIRLAA